MTDNNTLADYNIKGFDSYAFCDVCTFDGYPYEKVVFKHTGFRSEEEDGFAYKYTVNDFEYPDRIHIHRGLRRTSYLQQKNTSADDPILDSSLKEQFDNESCDIWAEYSDYSFRDAITFIDILPELFPRVFKKSISKSKELVN